MDLERSPPSTYWTPSDRGARQRMDMEDGMGDVRRFEWATRKAPVDPNRFADVDFSSITKKLSFSKSRYMDAEAPAVRRIR